MWPAFPWEQFIDTNICTNKESEQFPSVKGFQSKMKPEDMKQRISCMCLQE